MPGGRVPVLRHDGGRSEAMTPVPRCGMCRRRVTGGAGAFQAKSSDRAGVSPGRFAGRNAPRGRVRRESCDQGWAAISTTPADTAIAGLTPGGEQPGKLTTAALPGRHPWRPGLKPETEVGPGRE